MSNVIKIDFIGDIFEKCRLWQLRSIILIYLTKIPTAFFMACIVYTAPVPQRVELYCKDTTVGEEIQIVETPWTVITHPEVIEVNDKEFQLQYCDTYNDIKQHAWMYYGNKPHLIPWIKPEINDTQNSNSNEKLEELDETDDKLSPCDIFDSNGVEPVTMYDILCSRSALIILTQGIHLVGIFLSGIIARYAMKTISPKTVLRLAMVLQIISGTAAGTVEWLSVHLCFRCLAAIGCATAFAAGATIFSEITRQRTRTAAFVLFDIFWSIGILLLSVITQFESRWRQLYLIISYPTVLILLLTFWIPDAPRWLLRHNKIEKTQEILMQATKFSNKLDILPQNIFFHLKLQSNILKAELPPAKWIELWNEPVLKCLQLIFLHIAWSCFTIMYFGLVLNLRSYGKNSLPLNAVCVAISEIIGCCIGCCLAITIKRKYFWTGIFNIIGSAIAVCTWIFKDKALLNGNILLVFCLVMKSSVSSSYGILSACTENLVSKEKKAILVFSGILCGRLWLHFAPVIVALGTPFGEFVSFSIFACLGTLGGLSMILIDATTTKA